MYAQHFGFTESPFSITPDPRFVYLSARHREGLAHLMYGLGQSGSGGFVVLTGEVGTGKTTLCRLALEQLPAGTEVALILNPLLNPLELLESICEELKLDLDAVPLQNKALVDLLNRHLLSAHSQGKRVVLMLDEAQNLSTEALEQVRLLTNLETAKQKLLQIILLGQPELNVVLAKPELRQLSQRVTARFHLSELNAAETVGYIRHRLQVAGCERDLFEPGALRRLHALSQGIPRVINILADHSLLAGFAETKHRISVEMVNRAAREVLPRAAEYRRFSNRLRIASLVAGALLAALTGAFLWRSMVSTREAVGSALESRAGNSESGAPREAGNPATIDPILHYLRLLQLPPSPALRQSLIACPERIDSQWFCVRGSASASFFRKLAHPVLFRHVDQALHAFPPAASDDPSSALSFLAFYRKPQAAPEVFGLGYAGPGVAELARALHQVDDLEANQIIYGPKMRERVIHLQRGVGLSADGVVGPATWIALQDELNATLTP